MSTPRPAGAPVVAAGQQQQQQDGTSSKVKGILQSVAMFIAVQAAMRYGMQYMGIGPKPAANAPATTSAAGSTAAGVTPTAPAINADPLWPANTPFSMLLYTSTSPTGSDVDYNSPAVVWDGLTYGSWKDQREADLELSVPKSVRENNGTWWLDVVLVKDGGSAVTQRKPGDVAISRKLLTRFLPKKRVRKEKMLIGGDENSKEAEPDIEEPIERQIVAHWSRNLTLNIVSDRGAINFGGLAPHISPYYHLAPPAASMEAAKDETTKHYFPPVFPNDFWLLKENQYPINSTDFKLPLHVSYSPISNLKFQMYAALGQSMDQAAQQQGTGAEMDEVKRMLTETNPILLVTTLIVTILHTVFEFLAFSSDVSHWRKKDKDLVGVSLNTILTNCFVQLVILLYLQDSSEETSFMILFGQGIGLLIEAWKITKVVNIRIRSAPGTLIGYQITFEDKKQLSLEEKQTQEYDQQAFRIVSWFAIPLLLGYSVYSLLYETHRSWYSFVITTLAQAIYMFGFVQLIPQLIINYKLKSVAHMPMKAMMYKTLSTVVDDFFAFCIRMPWLHRLACFRDDAVFVVLLYQRWIYRIDYSRVNEYGQVQEGMAEPVGDADKAAAQGAGKGEKTETVESKKDQ